MTTCPTCTAVLTEDRGATLHCPEGHEYTLLSLSLATNRRTVEALWLAIRALEDDAAGLRLLAERPGALLPQDRGREADAAQQAAVHLRTYAVAAQQRLDALTADLRGGGSRGDRQQPGDGAG